MEVGKLQYKRSDQVGVLTLPGRLDKITAAELWPDCLSKVRADKPGTLVVDATNARYFDGAGLAMLLELKNVQKDAKGSFEIRGMGVEYEKLLSMFDPGAPPPQEPQEPAMTRMFTEIGMAVTGLVRSWGNKLSFIGELAAKLSAALLRPFSIRWRDTFLIAEKAGANAIGITALLGLLIGLILAFQSAIAMKAFGAEIYVANLVALSVFRELGPLITAFVLASRSGSAFAAEIGTMKINEEIDALVTMGIDPVKFLVIPRIIAATFVLPLLTMFNNFFGMLGAGIVMISIGFAPITVYNQIQGSVDLGDIFGGLAKTFVFGFLIAGIGCLRGLGTGTGASAVGDSATRAVVSGIVAIVLVDGVFAVLYYFLGL